MQLPEILAVAVIYIFTLLGMPSPLTESRLESLFKDVLGSYSNRSVSSNTVVRVIDGDTIELADGNIIRYIGIDAPELGSDCYSEEATKKNRELVEGKEVKLEKDVSDKDRYGRLLRYVYVDDILVNELLVREGFAYAKNYDPDTSYLEQFAVAEYKAKDSNMGLWNVCK